VAIDIPTMLVHLREQVTLDKAAHHRGPTPEAALMQSLAWVMRSPLRWRAALRSARVGRLLGVLPGAHGRIKSLPPPLGRWTTTRDLPLPPQESFHDWWDRERGGRS
jgi:L-lactate dehydrogenase complex protein LldF